MQHKQHPCGLPPTDARTEEVRRTIHTFLHTDRLHRIAIERALADLGIHHSQHRMLLHIKRHGGAVSQKTLAAEFDISPAAVAVTLGKLEKNGYIRRRPAEGDGRCKTIGLTEAGEEILRVSYDSFTAVDLAMFEALSGEELASFRGTLLRMQEALARLSPEGGEEEA